MQLRVMEQWRHTPMASKPLRELLCIMHILLKYVASGQDEGLRSVKHHGGRDLDALQLRTEVLAKGTH
jgi:hypothetical protein